MSYREHAHVHPEIDGVPGEAKVRLLNGSTLEFMITCSYKLPAVVEGGEPTLEPIHLTAEGYTDPVVAFSAQPSGLTGEAWVDAEDDSIVHVVYTAECPVAIDADFECETSILITRDTGIRGLRTDCLLRAELEIESSPLHAIEVVVS